MNYALLPILISLTFLAVVISTLAIQYYKNFLVTFVLIPITIVAGMVVYFTVDNLLGYPVPEQVLEDSTYIAHVASKDQKEIYVWLIAPGADKPKAVSVPATKNNKEQLSKAKNEQKKGNSQKLKGLPKKTGQGQTDGGELIVYPFVVTIGVSKTPADEHPDADAFRFLERRQ